MTWTSPQTSIVELIQRVSRSYVLLIVPLLIAVFSFIPTRGWSTENYEYFYHGIVAAKAKTPDEEAVREALHQVLLRLTARQDLRTQPQLQDMFDLPGRLMKSFVYLSPDNAFPTPRFRIEFDRKLITSYLESADIYMWGRKRPRVLLMLANYAGEGSKLLAVDGLVDPLTNRVQDLLYDNRIERGVIWMLPAGTLADQKVLEDDLRDRKVVEHLLKTYDVDAILYGSSQALNAKSNFVAWKFLGDISGDLLFTSDEQEDTQKDPEDNAQYATDLTPQNESLMRELEVAVNEVSNIFAELHLEPWNRSYQEVEIIIENLKNFASWYKLWGGLLERFPDQTRLPSSLEGSRISFTYIAEDGVANLRNELSQLPLLKPHRLVAKSGGGVRLGYRYHEEETLTQESQYD